MVKVTVPVGVPWYPPRRDDRRESHLLADRRRIDGGNAERGRGRLQAPPAFTVCVERPAARADVRIAAVRGRTDAAPRERRRDELCLGVAADD